MRSLVFILANLMAFSLLAETTEYVYETKSGAVGEIAIFDIKGQSSSPVQ